MLRITRSYKYKSKNFYSLRNIYFLIRKILSDIQKKLFHGAKNFSHCELKKKFLVFRNSVFLYSMTSSNKEKFFPTKMCNELEKI